MFRNISIALELMRVLRGRITRERIEGLVRHTLTTLGGLLVAHGRLDETLVEPMVGIGLAGLGMLWSILEKARVP